MSYGGKPLLDKAAVFGEVAQCEGQSVAGVGFEKSVFANMLVNFVGRSLRHANNKPRLGIEIVRWTTHMLRSGPLCL